jgi:hypothetical protein
MTVDIVLNAEGRPVFVEAPEVVRRRLKAGVPEAWVKVCVGETSQVVTIPDYLFGEKLKSIEDMIKEILRKSERSIYKRDRRLLDVQIERTARRIIEFVEKEKS